MAGGGLWEGAATGPCCPKLSCSPHLPWQTVSHEIVSPKSLHTWVVLIGYFVTVARTVTNTVYFFTGLITATLFVSWFFLENGSWIPPHSFTLGWLLSGCLHTLPLMAWVLVHNSCTGASLFLGVPCFGGAHQRVGWQVMSQGNKAGLSVCSTLKWLRGAACPLCLLPAILLQEQTVLGKETTGRSPVHPRWKSLGLCQVLLLHQVHIIHSEFLERQITCCCLTQSIGIWIFCCL